MINEDGMTDLEIGHSPVRFGCGREKRISNDQQGMSNDQVGTRMTDLEIGNSLLEIGHSPIRMRQGEGSPMINKEFPMINQAAAK